MPQPHTLRVSEIFGSIQGEGLHQGEPTIFIRLAGCSLRCSFCDTKSAWKGGRHISVQGVLEEVTRIHKAFPASWVCLTGGEPFEQEIRGLVRLLKKQKFRVQIETNGRRYIPLSADWVTISPKPPRYFYRSEFRRRAKEVKFVVTRDLDVDIIARFRKEFPAKTPILLQPQSNASWSMKKGLELMYSCLMKNLPNVKISIQLHKILGIK